MFWLPKYIQVENIGIAQKVVSSKVLTSRNPELKELKSIMGLTCWNLNHSKWIQSFTSTRVFFFFHCWIDGLMKNGITDMHKILLIIFLSISQSNYEKTWINVKFEDIKFTWQAFILSSWDFNRWVLLWCFTPLAWDFSRFYASEVLDSSPNWLGIWPVLEQGS